MKPIELWQRKMAKGMGLEMEFKHRPLYETRRRDSHTAPAPLSLGCHTHPRLLVVPLSTPPASHTTRVFFFFAVPRTTAPQQEQMQATAMTSTVMPQEVRRSGRNSPALLEDSGKGMHARVDCSDGIRLRTSACSASCNG